MGDGYVDYVQLIKGMNLPEVRASFETKEVPWTGVSPTSAFFTQTNTVKEGQRSIQFHSETPTVATADFGRLEVTGNTTYTLSAWIINKTTAGYFYIDWLEYNEEGIQIYDGGTLYTPVNHEWSLQSLEFTTLPQTKYILLRIVADNGAMGDGYVDYVSLIKGMNLPEVRASFETKEVPWTGVSPTSAFFTQTNTVKEGQRSIQFHSETPTVATANLGRIVVTGDTTYTLSAWMINKTTAGNFTIDWLEYNEEGVQIYDGGTLYTPVNPEWSLQSLEFTTLPWTKYIELRIVADYGATGDGYVDDVRLSK
ncbi:hypothetical protein [Paenibacillus puerhi]|uniref:hypothetical protein n=1 Tax=Paenibacillus puerhi TaxID=2692622 RepID=UPI00135A5E3F|nr:hypothetical protein [Paenibacillus puerhi]